MNVRPIKHAYFVREDDAESLARVIKLLCTQWGGLYSLIVPVGPDLTIPPLFEYMLRLHEPDRFVDFLTDPKQQDLEDHRHLQQLLAKLWPFRRIGLELGQLFEEHDHTAHALAVVSDEDLRAHTLTSYELLGPSTDRLILLVLFGSIFAGQEKYYEEVLGVKQRQIGIDSEDFWECQFDNSPFASALNLTTYGISPNTVAGGLHESNRFDIVLARSVSSLCMYWNYRATREVVQFRKEMSRRTLLLPYGVLTDSPALKRMESFLRSRLPYPNVSTNLHLRFCVWDEDDVARIRGAVQELEGLQEFAEDKISVRHTYGATEPQLEDLSGKPIAYDFFHFPSFPDSYLEGTGYQVGVNAELNYGRNEVFFNPPEGFRNRYGGEVSLDFECDVWQRYPREHRITEKIKSNSRFSRYGVSLIAGVADRAHYMDLNLPSEWETLELFFAARGYAIRVSRPGIYVGALIKLLGGLKGIELLASKPAYLLLDILALKSTKKLAQRVVQQLGLSADQAAGIQPLIEDMDIVPELKRIPKTYRQLCDAPLQAHRRELLGLLNQLSNRQIVKRGFYLTCGNCGTPSWHPLQTMDETIVCLGCSSEFPLPVEYPEESGNEIQWEYTLNTLVNRVMDQDALPAALAIHHLTKSLAKDKQACCIVPGLELLQSDSVKAELDFIFVSNQEVFAGECKTGTEIGDKDLETARLAANLGIHHFYYCTVKHFSQASQQRIEDIEREFEAESFSIQVDSLNGDDLLGEAVD
jgi:hypothetical protein